ncbi:MAG: heme exporter protein CcmB [Bacillota bacterium]
MKMLKTTFLLIKKDIQLEKNTAQLSSAGLLFALLAGIIFSMAFLPGQDQLPNFFPGIYWFTQVFAVMLILNRSFSRDTENSCQTAILMAPITREMLLLARIFANYLLFLLLSIIISPVLFILFDAFPVSGLFWLLLIVLLVNYGLAASGSLLAALTTSTRISDILLPVLLLPVLIPLILAAIETTRALYYSQLNHNQLYTWLLFIIIYNLISTLISYLLAPYLMIE